jgi:3-deoxy-manno-octulosonate cytidylyltransferase (CMP-KDO synthetase)
LIRSLNTTLDHNSGLYQLGVKDKYTACLEIMKKAGCSSEETAYIGDDSIDLPAFLACGISYAVADAPSYIKSRATGVLSLPGGHGAFRELADILLSEQGKEHVLQTADGFLSASSEVSQ